MMGKFVYGEHKIENFWELQKHKITILLLNHLI